ncbi:Cj0814 family flagellar-dependent secreted protein [Campylobacter aviculae]|uniref:Uncharacterized protein n=1 Tax=Campylobacter aviculae TaxID=2510190 RepID=A0A4U7BUG5_9BACT|nr:hypothetical protein [Campylobacter aviculae]TKX32664.1 hypothetical protein CQA76_03300 [Campylobacter aviculae]
MINNINSYSNYNHYTNTLNSNKKNSKTNNSVDNNNNKEINNNTNLNNNNNISNNTSLKQTNSNLVSDKSKAVNKILGYGVDEDGFFTSDFNEAAGIPKDYKIYAKGVQNLADWNAISTASTHTKIDFAKTIGNAYKLFSQIAPDTNSNSFTLEQLQSMPVAFVYDVDTFEITKTFNQDEAKDYYNKLNNIYTDTIHRVTQTYPNNDNLVNPKINSNSIFASSAITTDIGQNVYTNNDGSITKGGALMAFLNARFRMSDNSIIEGETSILGKILGFDKTMNANEIQSLKDFIQQNPITYSITGDIGVDFANMIKLRSNISDIEEFKKQWLEMKAKSDAMGEKYKAQIAQQNNSNLTQQTSETNQTKTKPFKPIQAESKNKETYKAKDTNELIKKLLENKFDLAKELEILFNVKIDNDNTNNNSNTNNNNSNDNNSNSNHLSKLSSRTKHRRVNIKV